MKSPDGGISLHGYILEIIVWRLELYDHGLGW